MTDSRVLDLLSRQQQLENDRATWDSHWQEVAERVLPRQDDFNRKRTVEGEKRTEKVFDSTAILALDRAASAIDSLISPSTQMYQAWEPEDDRLRTDKKVKEFLEELRNAQFRMRYRPSANFASQAHECYVSLMAFGTLGLFIDDVLGIGTRYKSVALSELYIAENYAGMIDYVHRKFEMSARAAAQKFGRDNLPEKIRHALDTFPFRKFEFLHCVKPNDERKPNRKDYTSYMWSSYYVSCEGKKMMGEGGYRTMPYAVSRHVTAPKETYGRSPAIMLLPDIKMVNEMEKTMLRAAHKIVDPPLLVYGDGVLGAFSTRPNALNFGGVDANGNQLVHPLKTGANLPVGIEMTEQKRKVINDGFYVTLFQILVQNPQMTATEALIRAQEKGQLLAPTVGRQHSEFLGPTSDREIDIMSAAGTFDPDGPLPMPEKLRRSGGGLKAVYTSPLTRLRRAEDGVAIQRMLDLAVKIKTADPESDVMDNIDDDATFKELAEIYGAPAKMLRATEVILDMREARAQAAQAAQQAVQIKDASGSAKNLAQAAQAAGLVTQQVPQLGA